MEVLLATSILLGSVIVLQELAHIGRTQANRSQDLAKAELLCLGKLNELLAGLASLEPVTDVPFELQPDWVYSVEIEPVEQTGLVAVKVEVTRDDEQTNAGAADRRHSTPFKLVRWVRGPASSWTEANERGLFESSRAAGGAGGFFAGAIGQGLNTQVDKLHEPHGGTPIR